MTKKESQRAKANKRDENKSSKSKMNKNERGKNTIKTRQDEKKEN